MGDTIILTPVRALKGGDLVDLEYDIYADPNGDDPMYEFELAEVDYAVYETPECIVVDFTHGACGFPPNHLVRVVDR